MEIPEDDSDLLGKTAIEIESDLRNRDVIMQHGLVEELTGPRLFGVSKPVDEIISSSTPWTRIRQLFNSDPTLSDTDLSKTGSRAIRLPLAIGCIVGVGVGFARLLTAYDEFVRANRLTAWRTREIAKRRAADYSSLKAITFGLSTGLKATFLAAGCYSFPLLLTAWQGKTSWWENAAGWGSACAIYCMGRGRRQMLVAGLIAAVPGLIYGSVNCVAARQLGLTFEDMYREHVTVMTRNQFVEP